MTVITPKEIQSARLFLIPLLRLLGTPVVKRLQKQNMRNKGPTIAKSLLDASAKRKGRATDVASALVQIEQHASCLLLQEDVKAEYGKVPDIEARIKALAPAYAQAIAPYMPEVDIRDTGESSVSREVYTQLNDQYSELLTSYASLQESTDLAQGIIKALEKTIFDTESEASPDDPDEEQEVKGNPTRVEKSTEQASADPFGF